MLININVVGVKPREEQKVRAICNKVLRIIFGPRRTKKIA
jgi:hypothetical protein